MLRALILLSIALALSLIGNGVALYRAGGQQAAADAALRAARDAGAVDALQGRADQVNAVAVAAQADSRDLLAQLQAIADRGRERVVEYRTTIKTLPPLSPGCGPGQARVDAVNRLSGARP